MYNYTLEATQHDPATWVIWVNGQFAIVFFFIFVSFYLFAKATGRIVRQIWNNEGSKCVVTSKEVTLGVWPMYHKFWGKTPKTEFFGGVNRTFMPKRQKL